MNLNKPVIYWFFYLEYLYLFLTFTTRKRINIICPEHKLVLSLKINIFRPRKSCLIWGKGRDTYIILKVTKSLSYKNEMTKLLLQASAQHHLSWPCHRNFWFNFYIFNQRCTCWLTSKFRGLEQMQFTNFFSRSTPHI